MAQPFDRRAPKYDEGTPALEWYQQPLYDTVQCTTTACTQMSFFVTPFGPGKTKRFTNMVSAATLSKPRVADIYWMKVQINEDHSVPLADVRKFYNNAWIEFVVGSKNYLTLPMESMPSGLGISGASTIDGGTITPVRQDQYTNGVPHISNMFNLTVQGAPIHIPSLQNFGVDIYISPAQTFSHVFYVTVYLWATMGREVQ